MTTTDFTTTLLVNQSPEKVFDTLKNVRGWWFGLHSESFEGESDKLGDEFSFFAGDGVHYSKQKLVELVPAKKIAWLVTDSKLTFAQNQTEWTGTKLCFEILAEGDATKIVFTHVGLVPEFECYDSCAPAWTQYIQEQLLNCINAAPVIKTVPASA
ncbi:SRPBCC domain-containing protein [Mucilaginibacter sp.]|uniref:SRPBCC family protein n=1 Tax=Mucilaginibacter sp. TaxID=1882438 RepID=UPI002ED34EB2